MKKIIILLLLLTSQAIANTSVTEFYEPNISNNFQGRLLSLNESYPIEKMKKLCEPYTGIDTAQIRCKKHSNKNTFICEFKCSLHWMID
tara:strand:+ start:221 stop:487 length:267 start_codon:yes stop_codon:yes gene_type:complete